MDWLDGQARRAWLDNQSRNLEGTLSYYLGPAAAPLGELGRAMAWLSPGADIVDATESSRDLMASRTPKDAVENMGWLGASMLGMALPGSVGSLRDATEGGIRAFHGSPHDFDAFDLSKMGTGEGAQAFGRGAYLAENEGTADFYRKSITGPRPDVTTKAQTELRKALDDEDWLGFDNVGQALNAIRSDPTWARRYDVDPDKAEVIKREFKQYEDALYGGRGHMYEVNINARPEDFLDWDKALLDQNDKVFDSVVTSLPSWNNDMLHLSGEGYKPMLRDPKVVDALREKGVAGVQYLDKGSRDVGEGSRNYVVFDPEMIEILRKYGLLGSVGAGGLAGAMMAPREDQRS